MYTHTHTDVRNICMLPLILNFDEFMEKEKKKAFKLVFNQESFGL